MAAPHHPAQAFLSKVHPKISVIEVGAGNSYDHPTSATLSRLAQVVSGVYRTDLNSEVTVTNDGSTYDVKNGTDGGGPCKNDYRATDGELTEFSRNDLRLLLQSI